MFCLDMGWKQILELAAGQKLQFWPALIYTSVCTCLCCVTHTYLPTVDLSKHTSPLYLGSLHERQYINVILTGQRDTACLKGSVESCSFKKRRIASPSCPTYYKKTLSREVGQGEFFSIKCFSDVQREAFFLGFLCSCAVCKSQFSVSY